MIKSLLILSSFLIGYATFAQDDCYKRLEDAFAKRGAYTVADEMHRNVILSYFGNEGTSCVSGKARVENGQIVSLFIQYDDNTYELIEKKFYNYKRAPPLIENGISQMIYTPDGEKFKVIFIEKLKPKQKTVKEAALPDEIAGNQDQKIETNPSTINPSIESNSEDWLSSGTGFFLSKDGYIATNYHVVENSNEIAVEFYHNAKKKRYNADIIVTDQVNDLAILKIIDTNFKFKTEIPYVFSTSIKDLATEVFTLGYPFSSIMGDQIKFTDGKISAKTGILDDVTVYQITVPIQPGNSGGPLFDGNGNLIGITSSALNKEFFNSENVNYAIKSSFLKNLIDVLPEKIKLPNYTSIYNLSLPEKVKLIEGYVPIILVK
jgi:S1-C subfamily serine protease